MKQARKMMRGAGAGGKAEESTLEEGYTVDENELKAIRVTSERKLEQVICDRDVSVEKKKKQCFMTGRQKVQLARERKSAGYRCPLQEDSVETCFSQLEKHTQTTITRKQKRVRALYSLPNAGGWCGD